MFKKTKATLPGSISIMVSNIGGPDRCCVTLEKPDLFFFCNSFAQAKANKHKLCNNNIRTAVVFAGLVSLHLMIAMDYHYFDYCLNAVTKAGEN